MRGDRLASLRIDGDAGGGSGGVIAGRRSSKRVTKEIDDQMEIKEQQRPLLVIHPPTDE